jgi:predicted O-methyltransferase YrrM
MATHLNGTICLNRSVLDFMESKLDEQSRVLEFGGGNSSLWFAERVGHLVVFETDPKWRRYIKRILTNADTGGFQILTRIEQAEKLRRFDLVLVDCDERMRKEAARTGWGKLAPGGWLIFDDAQRERHARAASWLANVAGRPRVLGWTEGDLREAEDRVALAWRKP